MDVFCAYCRIKRNSMPEHEEGCPNSETLEISFELALFQFNLGRIHGGLGHTSSHEYPVSYALGFKFPVREEKTLLVAAQ